MLLVNCTTTPETAFEWNVKDDFSRSAQAAPVSRPVAKPAPQQVAMVDTSYRQSASYVAMPRQKPSFSSAPSYSAPSSSSSSVQVSAPVAGAGSFVWPVSGNVISTFGTTQAGQRNDGINIATPLGTPIRAAASGTISYAGNELKGYGNLVLIRHDNGYVTAYAHADRLVVDRGDTVLKGQVIGYAGTTGDVQTPQVHFEIRRGVTPVNPQPLLVASR